MSENLEEEVLYGLDGDNIPPYFYRVNNIIFTIEYSKKEQYYYVSRMGSVEGNIQKITDEVVLDHMERLLQNISSLKRGE